MTIGILEVLDEFDAEDNWAYDESDLEAKILDMANIDARNEAEFSEFLSKKRRKRDDPSPTGRNIRSGLLHPYAFANHVGMGTVVDGLILSPYAFVTELLSYTLVTVRFLLTQKSIMPKNAEKLTHWSKKPFLTQVCY